MISHKMTRFDTEAKGNTEFLVRKSKGQLKPTLEPIVTMTFDSVRQFWGDYDV